MSNFTKSDLETILPCSILGNKYIYGLSNMVQTKAGTYQTIFIGDTQYYITPECNIGTHPTGTYVPMTPIQRQLVSQDKDEDQTKLRQHLEEIYGDSFKVDRHGSISKFSVIIAKLFCALETSSNQREIANLFNILDGLYPDVLTNMYILHRRGHVFDIGLPAHMTFGFHNMDLHINMITGNQIFVYNPLGNNCTVVLNPTSNGDNVLAELLTVMSNLIDLNDVCIRVGDQGGRTPKEEEEDIEDFIESLHDVVGRQLDESRLKLRLKLEHMLTALKIMEVYHGPTQIDNLSETVYCGTMGDETEIYFIGEDVPSKVLSKSAQMVRMESMIISRPGSIDLNPTDILELIPSDNLMYKMLDNLVQEVKEYLKDYRLNCNKLKDMRQYLPDEKDV